jgi:hypothetical protein
MPGIENKYFLLRADAPNVHFMTFAPTGVDAAYALGVFRRRAAGTGLGVGPAFTGLVRGGWVRDVSALGTVNDLLADWDPAQRRLGELASDAGDAGDWTGLAETTRWRSPGARTSRCTT